MLGLGINKGFNIISGVSYDESTQALLDQASTDGYTPASGTSLTALDTFISTLKSEGIWTLLDCLWLPATNGDSDFACYNLKDPTQFNLTKVNSPTFTSLEGFTGDGVSAYLDTNFTPSTDSISASQNSQSFGIYTRSQSTTGNQGVIASANTRFNRVNSTTQRWTIGGASFIESTVTGDSIGLLSSNREDGVNVNLYKNGVQQDTAINNSSLPNRYLTLLALNNQGSIIQFQDAEISFAYHGADLTSKMLVFYTAIQDYMTAIGSEV